MTVVRWEWRSKQWSKEDFLRMLADQIQGVSRYAEDSSGRADRIAEKVLSLLFDLSQQAARFGSTGTPWTHFAAYDADDFASFTVGGPA